MIIHYWARRLGNDTISFIEALTYMCFGVRGSGKSTLLEHIGEQFLKNKCPVLDLFGSRDGEGLAWLRSPWAEEKKILLLHGDNSSVACSHDSKPISQYNLKDLDNYDIIISSSPLYGSIDEEYLNVNKIIDECYTRRAWKKPVFITVREAANLVYSRMKVSPDQNFAKASTTYFIREARHTGFSIGLDTQKMMSIDSDIRVTIDYVFFKSLGIQGLPSDLKWLYKYYVPLSLQNMHPREFVMLTRTGSHGVGTFPFHKWHKLPGEDVLHHVGIEVEHGDTLTESKPNYQVGDLQHVEICELRKEGYTFEEIANQQGTSKATPWSHVKTHNDEVQKLGECQKCKRAKSPLSILTITGEKPVHE